jgi:cellulose synthase/poly-beta-1,6-N-acetylglucosamine synthase-like glycosyltransferase
VIVLALLAQLSAFILLAFSLRRGVLLLASGWPPSLNRPIPASPAVLILIPCRNESESLPGLFDSLDALDYPREQMQVVVVDDGSTDRTASLAQTWCAARPWARLISLPQSVGKPQALNEALTLFPPSPVEHFQPTSGMGGEVVVIYDSDHRPAPNSLRALVAPFADPRLAGVSGQMRVVNGHASPAAFYTMLESHVHQFITMRAKDRLTLAPALLGSNCAYRLSALRAVGGFTSGALVEDSDLTLAFALQGWRTRFAADSLSEHHAPVTLRGYLKQHLRWNRGFHQVAGKRLPALWASPQLSFLLKLELTFFSLGYADRLALFAGAFFTLVDFLHPGTFGFPRFVWLIYFGLPMLEMLAALLIARAPFQMYLRLAYVPFFFALDLAIAVWANLETLTRQPFKWSATERTRPPETTRP